MTASPIFGGRPREFEVTAGQLIWGLLVAIFAGIRLAGLLSLPVGGVELDSLAGAWQANAGNADDRFIPTLFQALTSWTFVATTSEFPARILAFAASCSIPFALWRLRPALGEMGAMAALLALAIDPFAVILGATAWTGAFDMAIVLWLIVMAREEGLPAWSYAIAGFVTATAGPIVLPAVIGVAAVRLVQQDYPPGTRLLWAAGGAVLGGLIAATGFGTGFQDPVLPPILAFTRGFDADWSSASSGSLFAFYGYPMLALGLLAALYHAYECWRDETWPPESVFVFAIWGLSAAWLALSWGTNSPVPFAAVSIPSALLIGRVAPAVARAFGDVAWLHAGPAVGGFTFLALVAGAFVIDWSRVGRVGDDQEKLIVIGLSIAMLAFAGLLLSARRTAPALIAPFIAAGLLLAISGSANVAFGGPTEPLPSPISDVQGREIRDIALNTRTEQGGLIVIHSDFKDESTWAMRDSGTIVYASRVPPDATVVVWPVTLPAPDRFAVVEGQWSFEEIRKGPDGDFLDYLRWLTNRNSLKNSTLPVAVYLRTTQ
ncbi:MAG: hypothetical protein AB7J35_03615 [Dehalococcoidia bacterium]